MILGPEMSILHRLLWVSVKVALMLTHSPWLAEKLPPLPYYTWVCFNSETLSMKLSMHLPSTMYISQKVQFRAVRADLRPVPRSGCWYIKKSHLCIFSEL